MNSELYKLIKVQYELAVSKLLTGVVSIVLWAVAFRYGNLFNRVNCDQWKPVVAKVASHML